MYETRVNLKHLLEDIRDAYPLPIEEVIIVELVANALDSKAKNLSFLIDVLENSLTLVDDGLGMRREVLKNYHNIAATTKQRGEGIGFAGVGAKLSLLLAKQVLTETKGGYGSRAATLWHLSSTARAPWKFTPFSGKVKTSRGTAISIFLPKEHSPLLSAEFVEKTIQKHFSALLLNDFQQKIFKFIYPKGVSFFVEGKQVKMPSIFEDVSAQEFFPIKPKGQRGRLVGFGFLAKNNDLVSDETNGVAISTYGKVIKRGWEWLGFDFKTSGLFGLVEIPQLSEILTTNKADFLQDGASLKKYYRLRKAVQEAILPALIKLGAEVPLLEKQKSFKNLSKEIQKALLDVLNSFPEITALFGFRKSVQGKKFKMADLPEIDFKTEKEINQEKKEKSQNSKKSKSSQKKEPKVVIGFEENNNKALLGRMLENTILVNKKHSAYLSALQKGFEEYHILLVVAWVLANFIEQGRSPLEFISQFFASFSQENQATLFNLRSKTT
ncbi:MAG: ATP-binding protein [bacterium]|nr:ATP-binding protein [bacterium]